MKYNPFLPDSIADPSMMAGRASELDIVKQSLFQTKHGNPPNLLITGEHGTGKSSLMNYICLMARGEIYADGEDFNFLAVSVSLSKARYRFDILNQILCGLRSALNSDTALNRRAERAWTLLSRPGAQHPASDASALESAANSAFDDLVSVLCEIEREGKYDGVAILMDEADCPPSSANLGALMKSITERLMMRGCNKVHFALAGLPPVVENLRESHMSSLRIFTFLNLEPLAENEQSEAVSRGINLANRQNPQKTSICDDAIGRLGELSEGYPHFFQQYAHSSFDSDVDGRITVEDVNFGANSENGAMWRIGEKYFDPMYFKNVRSEQYREVLQYMARADDTWISRKEILRFSGISERTVDSALRAMKQKRIIIADKRRAGRYRLPTRSFAIWISTVANGDCEAI